MADLWNWDQQNYLAVCETHYFVYFEMFHCDRIWFVFSFRFFWSSKSGSTGLTHFSKHKIPTGSQILKQLNWYVRSMCVRRWHLHLTSFSHFSFIKILTAHRWNAIVWLTRSIVRYTENDHRINKRKKRILASTIIIHFVGRPCRRRHANRFASVRALFNASERTCSHWAAATRHRNEWFSLFSLAVSLAPRHSYTNKCFRPNEQMPHRCVRVSSACVWEREGERTYLPHNAHIRTTDESTSPFADVECATESSLCAQFDIWLWLWV